MNNLFFYGAQCTPEIWAQLDPLITSLNPVYLAYPHEILQQAKSIPDLVNWAKQAILIEPDFDCFVGHSMGGLIALELATTFRVPCRKVVLIESNLKPANAFYRNLLTAENQTRFGDQVRRMLQSEAPFYSPSLKQSLQQDFDYTDLVRNCPVEIHAIYGDRGQPEYPQRIADLCLDEDITAQIQFHFVPDSCHLPMIENPAGLTEILNTVIAPSRQ
ncbi:MAG: alpha/beta hydrolase [Anaerolineaceae bacterium]|nr:alpha/beta hydrolase [Anaerolineaceae bacterium]